MKEELFEAVYREAVFKSDDVTKEADAYMSEVLDDIENPEVEKIRLGKYGEQEADLSEVRNIEDLDEKINEIRDLGCTIEAMDLFNTVFGKYFRWSQIFKGKYSGYDESKMKTDEQESLQAIYLAINMLGNDLKKDLTEEDFYNMNHPIYNNSICGMRCNFNLDLTKYKTQMKKLLNVVNISIPDELRNLSNFTIVQPDGLINSYIDSKITKKLFAKGFKFTSGLDKDTFAPADIYVINLDKRDELISRINALDKNISSDDFVSLTNDFMNNGVAYPVSLKMSSNPKFYKIINTDASSLDYFSLDDITKIFFNQKGNSQMEVKYNDHGTNKIALFEFRRKGQSATSWQCNVNIKGNTDAYAGGSAKTYMKLAFESELTGHISQDDIVKILNFEPFKGKISGVIQCALGKGAASESSQDGNIGLGVFCKELIEHQETKTIERDGLTEEFDNAFTYVIQHSFKKAPDIQNTFKIM